ncbi:MAG: hypothetical protein M1840_002604 [Geoglossum simile]|nr:MAG: hypothetical protein M1840_002604 [Geoglossum simile]
MGQVPSIDNPEEFYRPRTPLRFGSVPTALPVDPREYDIRGGEGSASGASVSSFNDIFPSILSQESYLDNFEESTSSLSPSTLSHQSCFSGYEGGISPRTRSIGTPSTPSLQGERHCQCIGRGFSNTGFHTEGELKDRICDHMCSPSPSSPANTPTDEEFADGIPFYFFPALCIDEEPALAKSRVLPNGLATTSWRARRQQDKQQPPRVSTISPSTKRRKITPPPSATAVRTLQPAPTLLSNPPPRRVTRTERSGPLPTLLQQQPHHLTSQCNCLQCQYQTPPTYLPNQNATTAPHQPSPSQSASPLTASLQAPLWQTPSATFTPAAAAAAVPGLQALPATQYEWQQQLPHMQQHPLASPQIGQQGGFVWDSLACSNSTYGVY